MHAYAQDASKKPRRGRMGGNQVWGGGGDKDEKSARVEGNGRFAVNGGGGKGEASQKEQKNAGKNDAAQTIIQDCWGPTWLYGGSGRGPVGHRVLSSLQSQDRIRPGATRRLMMREKRKASLLGAMPHGHYRTESRAPGGFVSETLRGVSWRLLESGIGAIHFRDVRYFEQLDILPILYNRKWWKN